MIIKFYFKILDEWQNSQKLTWIIENHKVGELFLKRVNTKITFRTMIHF